MYFGRQTLWVARGSKFTGKFSCVFNHAWNHLLWLTILISMVSPTSLKVYMIVCIFLILQIIMGYPYSVLWSFLASREWSPKVIPQQPVVGLGFCESQPYLWVSLFRQDTHCEVQPKTLVLWHQNVQLHFNYMLVTSQEHTRIRLKSKNINFQIEIESDIPTWTFPFHK